MSPSYVLGLVFALIIVVTVFMTMRNSGLKERYGLWWYVIAFFTLILSVFPSILRWTALHTGVVVPLNLGFFVAGVALEWLRRGLKILNSLEESEWIAKRVTDTAGVYFVPAFRGLSAPYWDSETRGMLIGLSEDTRRAHLVRAALAAMAYQVRDVYEAIRSDAALPIEELRVSGGASRNNLLMQMQAGILGLPVRRPVESETTALGAAYMAGLAAGLWKNTEELAALWQEDACFTPHFSKEERERLYDGWQNAVSHAMGWQG